MVMAERKWTVALCDRGLLDGLAYWPGDTRDFWAAAGTSLKAEYARYHAVIHLRTPNDDFGYNHVNSYLHILSFCRERTQHAGISSMMYCIACCTLGRKSRVLSTMR